MAVIARPPRLLLRASAIAAFALLLLIPAIANDFPLIFPDSGTYLGIAFGPEYAIDRSSFYGLALKPLVRAIPGVDGLWLAIGAQALFVAAILAFAARTIAPSWRVILLAPLVLLTSLPWHAGQFMPDALTGPLILLATLAALRDPADEGAPLLWLGAAACALTHYTHLVLLAMTAIIAIGAQAMLGLGLRAALRRSLTAVFVTASVAGALILANGVVLKRWTVSPMAPAFLFARLHQDGLIDPWLDRHCGHGAPAPLCTERRTWPRTSQMLLWGGAESPFTGHLWNPPSEAERWRWVAMMDIANRGAIGDRPLGFAASATRGALRQFVHFAMADDECPEGCGLNPAAGIYATLARYRPSALPALMASRQLHGTDHKALFRGVTTPIAAIALFLLPFAAYLAWRRRDRIAFVFAAAIMTALITNAALAGVLSDVHDRYQSRVIWLVPFLLTCLWLRWRRHPCPEPPTGA